VTRALPWHANGAVTYHNNTDCSVGTTGDMLRTAVGGTGEKKLCAECQRLNEDVPPLVRLAALDGVVADAEVLAGAPRRVRELWPLLGANLIAAGLYAAATVALEGYLLVEAATPPFIGGPALALTALLIGGLGVMPGLFLGAIVVNLGIFELAAGAAVGHAAVTVLAAAAAAWLMRFRSRTRRPALTLAEVLRLLVFGVVLHSAAAAIGHLLVDVLSARADEDWASSLRGGFVYAAAKIILLTPPVLLMWIDRRPLSGDRWPEMASIAVLIMLLAAVRMLTPMEIHAGVPFIVLYVSTWLSMRFPQREAFLLFAFAMAVATISNGIVGPTTATATNAMIIGFSIAAIMANVLLVASLAEERRVAMMLAGVHALAGGASRLSFVDLARQEAAVARERRAPLSIAVFDLDDDPPGVHDGARAAAVAAFERNLAAVIVPQSRRRHVLSHAGRAEFTLLLPKMTLSTAQAHCEYLLRAVNEAWRGEGVPNAPVTVSFGLTAFDPQGDTVEFALRRAQQALRFAKEIRGNRVAAA
jgi:GGDEF domain-containing protein